MSLRESINRNQGLVVVAALVLVAVAVSVSLATLWPSRQGLPERAFYTVDDGATWFAAGIDQLPPFDHEGQTAVRVRLFTCDGGDTVFAGYLERYTPQAREKLERQQADAVAAGKAPTEGVPYYAMDIAVNGTEVRKPEPGSEWVPLGERARSMPIVNIRCENGGELDSVVP